MYILYNNAKLLIQVYIFLLYIFPDITLNFPHLLRLHNPVKITPVVYNEISSTFQTPAVAFIVLVLGHAVAQLIEALSYKLEGRRFDTRWCFWNSSFFL